MKLPIVSEDEVEGERERERIAGTLVDGEMGVEVVDDSRAEQFGGKGLTRAETGGVLSVIVAAWVGLQDWIRAFDD